MKALPVAGIRKQISIRGRSLCWSIALGALLASAGPSRGDSPSNRWRELHDRYIQGMGGVQRDLTQWRAQTEKVRAQHASERDPTRREELSRQLAELYRRRDAFEKALERLDMGSRRLLMDEFVADVKGRYGPAGLRYTGGTPPGPKFRHGYGDFDLDAPEEHVASIRQTLEGFTSPGGVHETDDYLAVEELRLTIFKRREIRSLADIDGNIVEIERAAADPEVYLHILLPTASTNGIYEQSYADVVKALEVQDHIKKGLAGIGLAPPADLLAIHHLDDLQFLAKSVTKSLEAAGFGEEAETAALMGRVAGETGIARQAALALWINGFRGHLYYNPYVLGLDESNVVPFQKAARRLLQLAAEQADGRVAVARETLGSMRAGKIRPDLQARIEVALRLYGIQAGVNRGDLVGMPDGDKAEEVLAFFNLPEDFKVRSGVQDMAIQGAGRSFSTANFSPRGLTATWNSQPASGDFVAPANRPLWGNRQKIETKFAIRVAVAQFASDTEAKYAYRSGFAPESMKEEKAKIDKEEREIRQTELTQGPTTATATAPLEYPAKVGGVIQTDSLGASRQQIAVEAVGPAGVLVGRRHLQTILREKRETTSAELVNATPSNIQYLERMRQQVGPKGSVMATYRTTTLTERTVADPEMLEREKWQGLGRLGRCLIYIELDAAYGHETQHVGTYGKRIVKDMAVPPHWDGVANRFRRLMGRPATIALTIKVQPAGLDGEFKGVAADGISQLKIVADIVGDEESLGQIVSTQWEVQDVPRSCEAGEVREGDRLEKSGKNRRRVTGTFHPPESVPREHQQHIRLAVLLKDGTRVNSPALPIVVIPPPILLIHGLWSDSRAMAPLQEFLIQCGAATRGRCVAVDYGDASAKNLYDNARFVRKWMLGVLQARQDREKIKTTRVNIVAHSLGGLLARIVIAGRGNTTLPGDGDKVYKLITLATPHQGSALADWYSGWNPALFTDETDPSLQNFNELRSHLCTLADLKAMAEEGDTMRKNVFEFGPAVLALRTTKNPFLDQLNEAQRAGSHPHIRFYCVAGTVPFISRDYAGAAAVMIYNGTQAADLLGIPWPVNMANYVYSGLKSQKFKQMVTEGCDLISDPATDGVVHVNSASPPQYRKTLAGRLEVSVNHFDVPSDPIVLAKVLEWLTDGKVAPRTWTMVGSRSPGTLHVYDAEGRQVSRAAGSSVERAIPGSVHVPYTDPMGDHEFILLSGGVDVRVEFDATESGRVTLTSAHISKGGVGSHAFRSVRVESREKIRFETARPGETGQRVAVDGTVTPLEPVSYRLEAGSEQPEEVPLTATPAKPRENRAPRAKFSYLPTKPRPGEPVVVAATPSDPDRDRVTWRWLLDDGHLEPRNNARDFELSDLPAGTHRLRLEVTDAHGHQTVSEQEIVVSGEAVATVELPKTAAAAYAYSLECHEHLKAVLAADPQGVSGEARQARRRYDEALRHYQGLLQSGQ